MRGGAWKVSAFKSVAWRETFAVFVSIQFRYWFFYIDLNRISQVFTMFRK